MKQLLLVAALCVATFCYPQFTIDEAPHKQHAQQWTETYVNEKTPPAELQKLLNLCYFSYIRSIITLQAQEVTLPLLESMQHGYQNIFYTRMNPNHERPHFISNQQKNKNHFELFWQLHDAHKTIGLTYVQMLEYLLKKNGIKTKTIQEAAAMLRQQARNIKVAALYNINKLFYDFLSILQSKKTKTIKSMWDYLPLLSYRAFINAHFLYKKVNTKISSALLKLQKTDALLWQTIEEVRASFYLAHTKTLFEKMKSMNIDKQYFAIMLDEYGLLNKDEQIVQLDENNILSLDVIVGK